MDSFIEKYVVGFYLPTIEHRKDDTKKHLYNTNDDRKFHFKRIHESDFVFRQYPHWIYPKIVLHSGKVASNLQRCWIQKDGMFICKVGVGEITKK